jgi:hypothetical protein
MLGYTANVSGELAYNLAHMSEPEPTPLPRTPDRATERRTLKSRPTLVLLLLIGSCYAFGYTIFRLLKGMQR